MSKTLTDWQRVGVLVESAIEHIQSSWTALGTHTFEERYEKQWPLNSPQYHLQAAESNVKELYQQLHTQISEWEV